jgi:BirA family biotin operon repressor/biotin-[acetyl-CoA-carboxylase] ligase
MVSLKPALDIIQLDTVSSTMTEALEAASASKALPFWLLANEQTQGRGRRGKSWQSPKGNFYGTLVLHVEPNIPRQYYGLMFGVAVHRALQAQHSILNGKLHLKWPNDILCNGAKLAGLLAEIHDNKVLFGLGLNLNPVQDVQAYGKAAIALSEFDITLDATSFCAEVYTQLQDFIAQVRSHGLAILFNEWNSCALPKNTVIQVQCADGRKVKGLFQGLDAKGYLQLQSDAGLVSVAASDVIFQH